MEARPVELPYGLSSHHRHASRTSRSLALHYDSPPRWHTSSLNSWLQVAVQRTDQQQPPEEPRATDFGIRVSAPQTSPDTSEFLTMKKPGFRPKTPAEPGQDYGTSKAKTKKLQQPSKRLKTSADPSLNIPITIDSSDEASPMDTDDSKAKQSAKK